MEIARPGNCQNGKCTTWKIPEWKMHNLENDRKCTPWKLTENHAWEMTFLSISRVCIFCHFPCCAISIPSFSRCTFSVIFRVWFFCHFPGVHFPFCQFPVVFSVISRGVHFLPFSMLCIFHSFIFWVCFSVIFQYVHFLPFSCCAFSILSFSMSCNYMFPLSQTPSILT